mmetsp:Transcript_27467/g.54753  ORF Transcript_27467/g.54753 Transcript_27467/m.54753 type:complete len:83 (+) Transcript_27467:609-857(+)
MCMLPHSLGFTVSSSRRSFHLYAAIPCYSSIEDLCFLRYQFTLDDMNHLQNIFLMTSMAEGSSNSVRGSDGWLFSDFFFHSS